MSAINHLSNIGVAGIFGVGDYYSRRKEGESAFSAGANALLFGTLPSLLFDNFFLDAAVGLVVASPDIIDGLNKLSRQSESIRRQSSTPLTGYGHQPTQAAMNMMQRGQEAMGNSRGVSTAHASLAAQAFRK